MTNEYIRVIENMVKEFVRLYYTYDDWSSQDYDMMNNEKYWPWPIAIWDEFRGVDDIYVAIKHNLDRDKVFERYDYCMDKSFLEETPDNLLTFCRWPKEYTKEEQEKDQKAIKEAHKMLMWSIDDTLSKVNRLEIVSVCTEYAKTVKGIKKFDYQNNGETLKIFLNS